MSPSKLRLPATPYRYNSRVDHGTRPRTRGVVIHTIEGSASGAESWFKNPAARGVGTQVILGPSLKGGIVQTVDLDRKCWHAGTVGNAGYIGFEHEGRASYLKGAWLNRGSRRMLRQSANRLAYVCYVYNLGYPSKKNGNVLGHVNVAGNDHTDPGKGWPWIFYLQLARRAYKNLQRSNGRRWSR